LLAAAKSSCSTYLNIFKSTDNGATWSGTSGLIGKVVHSLVIKDTFCLGDVCGASQRKRHRAID
jgi:hypothetical protein